MKTLALVTAAGLAAFFSIAASAQTGRPSAVEVPAAADRPTSNAAGYGETTGSYARYLMLNGATRENALVAARNVDHPVERAPRLAANRGVAHEPSHQ
jgi:hypothetical protein